MIRVIWGVYSSAFRGENSRLIKKTDGDPSDTREYTEKFTVSGRRAGEYNSDRKEDRYQEGDEACENRASGRKVDSTVSPMESSVFSLLRATKFLPLFPYYAPALQLSHPDVWQATVIVPSGCMETTDACSYMVCSSSGSWFLRSGRGDVSDGFNICSLARSVNLHDHPLQFKHSPGLRRS